MISFEEFISESVEVKDDVQLITLTSRSKTGKYFRTARVIDEICKKLGIKHYVVFAEDAYLERVSNGSFIIHNIDDEIGFPINPNNTAVIIRGSVTALQASMDLVSQLERHDFFCTNGRTCIEECSDKYRTALKMADFGVTTPKTALVSGEKGIDAAFKRVGGKFPVVVKTLQGSKGVGVFIVDTEEGMKSSLQTIWKVSNKKTEVLFQEFLLADYDMRVHVLGGEVIASMKRFKIKKDFRSNYSLGGDVKSVKLTDEQKELAILASKSVNAVWAGVDIMKTKDGKSFVIEINSSPGTEGIEKATEIGVVEKVVRYVTNKKNWHRKPKECGFIETINIDGIGDVDAKFDTGNGSYCVIHADKWEIKDDFITWTNNGKEYEHKVESVKKFKRGGVRNEEEERAVILMNVTFNNDTFENIKFAISNRKGMTTPVLLNRAFLRKANVVINSTRKYVMTVNKKDFLDEGVVGGKDWWASLSKEKKLEWVKKYPNGNAKKKVETGEWVIDGDEAGDITDKDKPEEGITDKDKPNDLKDTKKPLDKSKTIDKMVKYITQPTVRDVIAKNKNVKNERNLHDSDITSLISDVVNNDSLTTTQKQVYMDFFKDVRESFGSESVSNNLKKIIDNYQLEVNKEGQVYVNSVKKKGDDNTAKKGISKSKSQKLIDMFNEYDVSLKYEESDKSPEHILSATAKPNLGNTSFKADNDVNVKEIFDSEPLKSFDNKFKQVYGPSVDGLLLANKNGKHAKEYFKHSVESNKALDDTIEMANKLVKSGKLKEGVYNSLVEHKNNLVSILEKHEIPSEEATEAVGSSYATLASSVYKEDKKVAEGIMKQIAEMALYDTELVKGEEVYLPAHGSFPSGDKLKIVRDGTHIELVSSVSVKYGLSGGEFGAYGFPGETAQYQKYHPDKTKRDILSNKPGSEGYICGVKDSYIDNSTEFNKLIGKTDFKTVVEKKFHSYMKKYKDDAQKIIEKYNGNLILAKKDLDKLDSDYSADIYKYMDIKKLPDILNSDNASLALKSGPACLISMIGFSHVLKTSKGLPTIEHNHQQFIHGTYYSSTDDSSKGTSEISNWKLIWRPRGERTQGIAASFNSNRVKMKDSRKLL